MPKFKCVECGEHYEAEEDEKLCDDCAFAEDNEEEDEDE